MVVHMGGGLTDLDCLVIFAVAISVATATAAFAIIFYLGLTYF